MTVEDSFEGRVRALCPNARDRAPIDRFLAARRFFHAQSLKMRADELTAAQLNAHNQRFLDDAAKILGSARYRIIFGVDAGVKVDLVDPYTLEQARHTGK